nr:MAG TPA: hypothetical protein [Caudoviricetes sp.]
MGFVAVVPLGAVESRYHFRRCQCKRIATVGQFSDRFYCLTHRAFNRKNGISPNRYIRSCTPSQHRTSDSHAGSIPAALNFNVE